MNITPALPNPYQLPADQDRTAVGAVRAPNRPRDAADQPERRPPSASMVDPAARERIAAQADTLVTRHQTGSVRVNRALASYEQVADSGESSGLRELLGFDAYA